MTPTSFQFTLTMPADARLVGAVRELVAQAATYGQLSADAAAAMAERVATETEKAIGKAGARDKPLEIIFGGDGQTLSVTISSNSVQIGRIQQTLPG
jgi:hypothetical protein